MYGRIQNRIFDVLNVLFFILMGFTVLYPLWYVLIFSLSDPSKMRLDSYYLLPEGFTLETYRYMLRQTSIYNGYKNTIFVTVFGTLVNLLLTVTTAYPLSRNHFSGRKVLFGAILFTMLFSGGMIPTYLIVRSLGLVNSLWALILPSAISVYNLLVMIKFFKTIPNSLIEASKIDGYNDVAILFKVILPLSPAALATIGLFYAVAHWNSFFSCIMYINDTDKYVLQVILRNMFSEESLGKEVRASSQISTPEHFRMATIIITTIPILMAYPFLQKYFMKGVMLGSVKE